MKNKGFLVWGVFTFLIIGLCAYNFFQNANFLEASLIETAILAVGVFLTHGLSEYKNDKRKRTEFIEQQIISLQNIIHKGQFLSEGEDIKKVDVLLFQRQISNKAHLLNKFYVGEKTRYIQNEIYLYKELTDNHIEDLSQLNSISIDLKTRLININNKLDEILYDLYFPKKGAKG